MVADALPASARCGFVEGFVGVTAVNVVDFCFSVSRWSLAPPRSSVFLGEVEGGVPPPAPFLLEEEDDEPRFSFCGEGELILHVKGRGNQLITS